MEGSRVGRYVLGERLGSGGMGVVWEARDPTSGQPVALKIMHRHLVSDRDLVERFRREYEVGLRAVHPSLVRTLDYGLDGEVPYLVMERAYGKSLRRLIERGGRFREWEVAVIGAQVAGALASLHASGVLHRDLKSSNIVVERDLGTRVIDYGIAKIIGSDTISMPGSFIGTAEFSAPDVYFGRAHTDRSDVYSLGVAMYEALTGAVPFRSERYVDVLRMHAELPVPDIGQAAPLTGPRMRELISRMLDKSPQNRPSAAETAAIYREIAMEHGREGAAHPALATFDYDPPPQPVVPVESWRVDRQAGRTGGTGFALVAVAGVATVGVAVIVAVAGGS